VKKDVPLGAAETLLSTRPIADIAEALGRVDDSGVGRPPDAKVLVSRPEARLEVAEVIRRPEGIAERERLCGRPLKGSCGGNAPAPMRPCGVERPAEESDAPSGGMYGVDDDGAAQGASGGTAEGASSGPWEKRARRELLIGPVVIDDVAGEALTGRVA
jgi:hypothetical protein